MKIDIQTQVAIIASAETLRFFSAKAEEKIIGLVLDVADDTGIDSVTVASVLESEKEKRSAAHAEKIRRVLERQQAAENMPVSGGVDSIVHEIKQGDKFIVTVAQNNTDVNASMLAALETFAKHEGAELIVCKTLYNTKGFAQPGKTADNNKDYYFAPELAKYFQDAPCYLGTPQLFLAADANVIPTAKNPLAAFEGLTHAGVSMVIPAVKISLRCTAALKGATGKDLFSTGAITKSNYVQRKAGQVAQHEHNIGALFVQVFEDGTFTARQLEQMANFDGFYDKGRLYTGEGVTEVDAVACLQFGDIHAEKMTAENMLQACDIVREYNPQNIMLHDVLDFSSRNHHNIKDSFFVARNDAQGASVVCDLNAVSAAIRQFAECANDGATIHIIESNHDLALEKWIKESDFKKDSLNAGVYLPLALAMVKAAYGGEEINLLEYALTLSRGELSDSSGNENEPISGGVYQMVNFHNTDESVMIAGVEHGVHGHSGLNGSRGSPAQFRTLGVRMNTGHTHTPSIMGGVYTAGVTASLEMGYNVGPSSWRIAHVVTYVNGQRQVIFM